MTELDKLFSPSEWTKRLSPEDVIKHHIDFVTRVSDDAKLNIPCQLDVPYGKSLINNEKLDIFGIDLPEDSPIFIYIHGGYWQELSHQISSYVVAPLYKNKVKVFVIGYNLCPAVKLPEIIKEIQKAFSFCIAYARCKKSRGIYIGGHSAGAHLVATLFNDFFENLLVEDQALLKAVYFISGVYDLIPLINTYVNNPLKLNVQSAREISPLYQEFKTPNKKILFYVIVGEFESPEFHKQSDLFFEKLIKLNLKTEMIVVKNRDHFDIVECLNNECYQIVQLIINNIDL